VGVLFSTFQMAFVVVTGGSGFVGSHLIKALALDDRVESVLNIDINPSSQIVCDISDFRSLEKALQPYRSRITDIVHLAALPGVRKSLDEPIECVNNNVIGTVNILEISRGLPNLVRIVIASSSSVYGARGGVMKESDDLTDSPPVSIYAASKRSIEIFASTYSALYKTSIVCLRLFTVYGPKGRMDMAVGRFINAIQNDIPIKVLGDGSAKRDFTYIAETVRGIVCAMFSPNIPKLFSVYNICSGRSVSLRELISMIEKTAKTTFKEITYSPDELGDVSVTHGDCSLALSELGFRATVMLEEGIRMTL
jgi:UDP-glucuronate 4-epimerase